ncbi:putative WD repeat-containing protein [Wickerhamomyces ciferrii]|uniref:WD repeat-containing protein n=1 Tax=Wickerhamomyces ciferrii (strain ATCC 14091 / BCRC 22168 / CBS 111 / JCM 3599 / NBRC 0793 / NRRL Y-1031 F-60-10) TaxID=1206466 RepID=K0KAY9_WICCF|nr:putative WD repeat-containing protein [Wickerhamomyces ciferrii]CCH42165.1 putative WD repeat-containing protein [Wickerhamomyces ciferrii]
MTVQYFRDLVTVTLPDNANASRTSRYRPNEVITLQWNNPASRIAYSRTDGTLRIWKLNNCELVNLPPVVIDDCHAKQVESISWNPASETDLATVGNDEKVKIWNTQRGALIKEMDVGVNGNILVQYSGDAKYIVSISKQNVINIIDSKSYNIVETIKIEKNVYSVTWNNNSSFLFFGLSDGSILLYKFANDKLNHLHTLKGHRSIIKSLKFEARGNRLVAGSNEGSVTIWSMDTMAVTSIYAEIDEPVAQVDISRDGTYLSITYEDGEPAKIFEISSHNEFHKLPKCIAGASTYPNLWFCPIKTLFAYSTSDGEVLLTMKGSGQGGRSRDR